MTRGIFYIAVGDEFVEEARRSARTVRQTMEDVPIAIAADRAVDDPHFDRVINVEDPHYGFGDKVEYMAETPFDRTLYLDTDIYMYEGVEELFDLLDRFDMAAAHNHNREAWEFEDVPESFPEYNTGVIAYASNPRTDQFFERWNQEYFDGASEGTQQNQPSFRRTLYWDDDLRFSALTPEYNCMIRYPGHAIKTVKLFHGRLTDVQEGGADKYFDVERAAGKINKTEHHRIYTRGGRRVIAVGWKNALFKLRLSVQRNGVLETVRRVLSRVRDSLS